MNENKKRLQFDFTEKALIQLDALGEKIHASSRAEVIRRALEFFDKIITLKENNFEIILKSNKGEERIIIL